MRSMAQSLHLWLLFAILYSVNGGPTSCANPAGVKAFAKKFGELGPDPSDDASDVIKKEYEEAWAAIRNEYLTLSEVSDLIKNCQGIFNRAFAKALKNGNFDQARVDNFMRRAIPHKYDYKDCSNITDAMSKFATNLVGEGMFDLEGYKEVFDKARIGTELTEDDVEKCFQSWGRIYRAEFKKAGMYHGAGRDWFDNTLGYEPDWLKETTSSEEVESLSTS